MAAIGALFGVVFCNSFGAFVLSRDVGSSADAKEPTSRAAATNIACCLMNYLCRPSPRETSANSSSSRRGNDSADLVCLARCQKSAQYALRQQVPSPRHRTTPTRRRALARPNVHFDLRYENVLSKERSAVGNVPTSAAPRDNLVAGRTERAVAFHNHEGEWRSTPTPSTQRQLRAARASQHQNQMSDIPPAPAKSPIVIIGLLALAEVMLAADRLQRMVGDIEPVQSNGSGGLPLTDSTRSCGKAR